MSDDRISTLATEHMTIRFKPVIVAGGVTLHREAKPSSLRTKLALAGAGTLATVAALALALV